MPDDTMTVTQAARAAGVSRTTILELIRSEQLPARRKVPVGNGKNRHWLIERADLEALFGKGTSAA